MPLEVKNDFLTYMITLDGPGLERQLRAIINCVSIDENEENLPHYKDQIAVLAAIGRFKFGENLSLDQ